MISHFYLSNTTRNGEPWEGPKFLATSLEEAKQKARYYGVILLGQWMMTIIVPSDQNITALADLIIQWEKDKKESRPIQ